MNDISPEMISAVQDYLQNNIDNFYSFETDLGKSHLITGKVVVNYQWSGDGVYTLDQAEIDGLYLEYAVPEEVTNIYFDGWVMLKNGIDGDPEKQQAAEAFINFLSRPDNVVRNMYYIGYTSVIAGGDDSRIYEYADWCYGAEDDEEETAEYPVGYFFSGDSEDEDYMLTVPADQVNRQMSAAYPPADVIGRASIMTYFDAEQNELINQMWVRIRCYNINNVPAWGWILLAVCAAGFAAFLVIRKRRRERAWQ
jgi:spermidine/putrescine transport system substrate-binding protein